MADLKRELAERLIHEREAKSLSREALAIRAGVDAKTIKRIEEQKVANPRPVTIRRLAEALEIDPARLRPPEELEADQLARIESQLSQIMERLGISDGENPGSGDDPASKRAPQVAREALERHPDTHRRSA